MNENTLYCLWLQKCLGYASNKIKRILDLYPSIKDFYLSESKEWRLCGCFTEKEFNKLTTIKINDVKSILDRCNELGIKIITIEDTIYPKRLLEISNPPIVLYIKGTLPDLENYLCIAMVGTRKATHSGLAAAYNISLNLAKCGVIVVSGGALGVDTASHKGVLQANGVTMCVLGCGINYDYLKVNEEMRNQIALNGAVISEFPPDTPPDRYTFPIRNRIISGISNGVVVIEAGKKSGALITADFALEQNRDVFAVPGDITQSTWFGANELIKSGAKPVTSFADILEEYLSDVEDDEVEFTDNIPEIPVKKSTKSLKTVKKTASEQTKENFTKQETVNKHNTDELSHNAKIIYDIIFANHSNIDDIIVKTNLSVSLIMQALTELELLQFIERRSGRMYYPI